MIVNVREDRTGSAMDVEDGRIGFSFFIVRRFHDPAMDFITVFCPKDQRFRAGKLVFLFQPVIEMSHLHTVDIELCQLHSLKFTACQVIAADIEAVAGASFCQRAGNGSILFQQVKEGKVVDRGDKIEISVHSLMGLPAAVSCVASHRGADEIVIRSKKA